MSFELKSSDAGTALFLELYTSHEARLRSYIMLLLPRWSDAEDVAQRCSLILWKKFDKFDPTTSFYAWACQIARLEVKEFKRKAARGRVIFSDEFIDAVADTVVQMEPESNERMNALQKCVESLSHDHRELLRLRYDEARSVRSVAQAINKPIEGVYKSLSRIRRALFLCVENRLTTGGV